MSLSKCRRSTVLVGLATWIGWLLAACPVTGQVVVQQIGGVKIDAYGVITRAPVELRKTAAELIRERLQEVPTELAAHSELRFVSLKQVEAALQNAIAMGEPVSDEIRYLHGLQRIDYLLVYPERQDIVLAGPGEAWTVSPFGDIVGATSSMPVLLLDDLLVALRSTEAARTVGVSCSIDPTPEGRQALDQFLARQKRFHPRVTDGVEQALGAQQISITGVPADSHFAGVLVAADFQMKRYAMGLEPAPIAGLPSFLQMIKKSGRTSTNLMPRWWMGCDYESLGKTADGLGWQLRGRGVKVMTEDDFVNADGSTTGSGQTNPVAEEWANRMTERFDELAQVESVFGQVRNLMELSIIAALIAREDLPAVAGCQLETMMNHSAGYEIEKWPTPKSVATQSSFMKVGRDYVITASGGVLLDPWTVIENSIVDPALDSVYEQGK